MAKRRFHLLCLLLASALATTGMAGDCTGLNLPGTPGGTVCTQIAVPSVILDLVDENNDPIPLASIRFRINNGPWIEGGCDGNCTGLVLIFERVGAFNIEVAAPGRIPAARNLTIQIDAAGCHPVTERRTIVLPADDTVAALAGAWRTVNFLGETILRFGDDGRIIGAILVDRIVSGDGNIYAAYNAQQIRGVPGQTFITDVADDPTRTGERFDFSTTTQSFPIGFTDATMSADFTTLTGTLSGLTVTYTRLEEIPEPLRDP